MKKNAVIPLSVFLILIFCHQLQAQNLVCSWAKSFGSALNDYVLDIAADHSGNVYLGGEYRHDFTIGSNILMHSGPLDGFIAKCDAEGNIVWAKKLGGNGTDYVIRIATDADNNVFVLGSYTSTNLNLGTSVLTNSGMSDFYLLKYSPDGTLLWSKTFSTTLVDQPGALSVFNDGSVVVSGATSAASIQIGSDTLTTPSVGYSFSFIAKYDGNGNYIGSNVFTEKTSAIALQTDEAGNLYAGGNFTYSITVAGTTITSFESIDFFIVKYDTTGNPVWVRSYGGDGDDRLEAFGITNSGELLACGTFEGPVLQLEASLLLRESAESADFVAKFDSEGIPVWAKKTNGGSNNSTTKLKNITADGNDNIYISGTYSNAANFDGIVFGPAGTVSFFLKIGTDGITQWVHRVLSPSVSESGYIDQDNEGNLIFSGMYTSPSAMVGNISLTGQGLCDVFISKFIPENLSTGEVQNNTFAVYPNPAENELHLNTDISEMPFTIADSTGRIVSSGICAENTICVDKLPAGIYILFVGDKNIRFVKK